MNLEELEAKVNNLEDELKALKDVEQIKKLQRVYGYYLDHCLYDEIIDCFSDDTESVEISNTGVYLGKDGAKKILKLVCESSKYEGMLGIHMQLQGVVNLDSDGKTAKGRWRCLMIMATPIEGKLGAVWGHGVYENEYVKEGGKWKIKKLHFFLTFRTPFEDGWVKTPIVGMGASPPDTVKPDKPTTVHEPYPAAYVVPFHYGHPVSEG
ncbi:nuclear transport factor 2 family protein [Thermodesulfobacteriota bacterium]